LHATPVDPWLGRVLDERYRVTERLGEGGMGAVFVAEHLKLRKPVALKVIRAELVGNGEVAARFAREAMATAQFEHPHVASAIDFGTLPEGGAYLVMQLVRGQSLRELLDQHGRMAWPLACELLAQVADALSAARFAGIVHRDLKPENILVETREDGSLLAKILDFGIAHVAPQPAANDTNFGGAHERALTRVGTVMGTPGYMSPEQAVGDRVDHRTDLYALGVVLWECVVGRPLWDGPDVTSIIMKQLREEVPHVRELALDPLLPRALDNLLQRLCARTPELRPEHAGLVRDELRALARQNSTPSAVLAERASHSISSARARFLALSPASRGLFLSAIAAIVLALVAVIAGRRNVEHANAALPSSPADAAAANGQSPTFAERAINMVTGKPGAKNEPQATIPKELTQDVQTLLESPRATERRRAAFKLLHYKPASQVFPYLLAIAELEKARNCRERKEAIADISELKDKRCLPALRRLADASRSGCGFLGFEDCYSCIRGDLRRSIDQLEAR
jgi:eukaryotic-like serine/threonine-protein kinase